MTIFSHPYLIALHLIFVITWFAGLFYIVRLFVYHAEAKQMNEPDRSILINHFKGAEKRLWYGITWPSAILTLIFGYLLWIKQYGGFTPPWLWLKFGFVLGLFIYHILCGRMLRNFQKDDFKYTGIQMRMWNEVATLFLVAIIFVISMKDTFSWIPGLLGLVAFSLLLVAGIRLYKKLREKK